MSTLFKTQIQNIRKEAIELGYSVRTMNGYLSIWNSFIQWKNEDNFIYNESDYSKFLLERYHFDVTLHNNKVKSHFKQLMRSKKILDNFDVYKIFMKKRVLPKSLYNDYPSDWNITLDKYLDYCKNVRYNSENTIKLKHYYLKCVLSYLFQNNILELKDINKTIVVNFINENIEKGNISKKRCFYVFRDFLKFLFVEDILKSNLSIYIPTFKNGNSRKKVPTYLKEEEIDNLLNSITKNTKIEIRDYTIILIAARLGLRISDILNIKLKDIDWQNHKLNIIQPKTKNLNVLPLYNEIGWAIIDYIKKSRPKCNNEYLFVKSRYPFEKMNQFYRFNKYFDKIDIENKTDKKGIHNLRHSLASNMLNHDIPLDIISSTLGDTLETTSNTYLKIDIKKLSKCNLEVD